MRKTTKILLLTAALAACAAAAVLASGAPLTSHPVAPAALGQPSSSSELEAVIDRPGRMRVETIVAADWEVPLDGLLNLEHPRAQAAGLQDRSEKIQIYFHVLRHPTQGTFIVDSGVERAVKSAPERSAIRGVVARFMQLDAMQVHTDTASWLATQKAPLRGVLLTHLHLDHVSGLPDIPKGTPIYAGPGETEERDLLHFAVRPTIDRALAGHAPIQEWRFVADPDGRLPAVVDVFGDRELFAISVPGHTRGSTAFVARTAQGPVLMTGDASHTDWGWQHGVEPGSYSRDRSASARSLASLKALAERHPHMRILLGHQPLAGAPSQSKQAKR